MIFFIPLHEFAKALAESDTGRKTEVALLSRCIGVCSWLVAGLHRN